MHSIFHHLLFRPPLFSSWSLQLFYHFVWNGVIWFHGFLLCTWREHIHFSIHSTILIRFLHSSLHTFCLIFYYIAIAILNFILSFPYCLCWFYFSRLQVRLVFNKSVSWVRVRDDHILTVDQITFIADERFHAYHATENGVAQQSSSSATSTLSNQRRQLASGGTGSGGGSNSVSSSSSSQKSDSDPNGTGSNANSANAPWTLQIKYVQARDAGLYECQISSEPKISARVYLHVVGKLNKQNTQNNCILNSQQFFKLRILEVNEIEIKKIGDHTSAKWAHLHRWENRPHGW